MWLWRISGFCGYGDSVGISTGFSVGMGWVWALKFNSHGSPELNGVPQRFTGDMAARIYNILYCACTNVCGVYIYTACVHKGLICWTCYNKSNNKQCNDWAPNMSCPPSKIYLLIYFVVYSGNAFYHRLVRIC